MRCTEGPKIDVSKDEKFLPVFTSSHLYAPDPTDPQYMRSTSFVRKQVGKKGAHAGTLGSEPPVEESSQGNTLPPDDASSKKANRKRDRASTEKLQMMSVVNSLKRNLAPFKKASDREDVHFAPDTSLFVKMHLKSGDGFVQE